MRNITLLLIISALLGMNGCIATSGSLAGSKVSYGEFHDSYGEYRIVNRNNDLYVEKLDESESRRITNEPRMQEKFARFIKNGKYIIYLYGDYGFWGNVEIKSCYIIPSDGDDSKRKEISDTEFWSLRGEGRRQ